MRALVIKLAALTLLLLVGVAARATPGLSPDAQSDKSPSMPSPGDGRTLVFEACVQCHDLREVVSQRKTAAGWRRTVNEMIWRGAPLLAEEIEPVVQYLTQTYGPDAPAPEAPKKSSPSGGKKEPGKAKEGPKQSSTGAKQNPA